MLLRRLCGCCVLLLVLLMTTSAFAQEWTTTFEAEAVNSYVAQEDLKFIVVAAGEADASTEAAAEALADALRAGSAQLVMNDDPLGAVKGLDDDEILAKAEALPADRVAIVRVFPGGQGNPETVVVTVRAKNGEAVWALSSASGTAVEANETKLVALGVSREASKAVGEVTESETKSSEDAREEYAKRIIWFHSMIGVNQYGSVVSSWSTPYKGKYKERLEPEDFYREVGRPDLAEEYAANATRATLGGSLTGIGLLGVIGGGTWWLVKGVSGGPDANPDTTLPMAVTAGGAAMMVLGIIVSPSEVHPVSSSKALELADKHNQKLKEELGLSRDYSPLPRAEKQSFKYNLSVGATPGGAAGVLRIEF